MQQLQRYFRKAGKAIARFFARVAHGSVLDIAILVCAVALVGVGATIAVISGRPRSVPVDASSSVPSSVSVPTASSVPSASSDGYDPNENALSLSEYDGTVLTETADGGVAYLEETLFIGDSNTYRLATYGLTSWQNNLSAVGMGIQHVTSTPSMLFKGMDNYVYMARAVAMMQPRRIVITYGTNNTDSSVGSFKDQYRAALEAIKKEWPYADIIINAIPPVARSRSNAAATQKKIDEFNKALADLAREDGYQFLNSSEVLRDPATGFAKAEYVIGDGLHLSEEGAKALIGYVRGHTHVVADTRPALTSLPVHMPTPEELFNPQAAASSSSSSSSSSKVEGVTVRFFVKGDQNGSLSGTLTQLVKPGQACQPVTATANAGFAMTWGCTEGRLYEGDGLSKVNNNAQTATYVVPANTTATTLDVWVTFSQSHIHTLGAWTDTKDGTHHYRECITPNCPDSTKLREEQEHTWGKTNDSTGMRSCTLCGATSTDPNWTAPHEHTWGSTDSATGQRTCTGCGATETDPNWSAPPPPHEHTWGATDPATGQRTCTGCGVTENDSNWSPPQQENPPASDTTQNGSTGSAADTASPEAPAA